MWIYKDEQVMDASIKWQDYYFCVPVCFVSCNKSKGTDEALEMRKLPLFGTNREGLSE